MLNSEIYAYANALVESFQDSTQRLPIKINFYLQKNRETLIALAREIEESRMEIIKAHAKVDDEGNYNIADEKELVLAQNELNELLSLEQEVQIYKVNIDNLPDDIILTTGQMEVLMFMID
jgi:hypothetical protein